MSKSRRENKNKDLYETEVRIHSGNIGSLTATLLATVFFVIQSLMGNGFNFGLYAIILSTSAASSIYTAVRMKRKKDIIFATVYTLATIVLSAAHIIKLITSHTGYSW